MVCHARKETQIRVRPPHDLPYLPVLKDVPPWKASTNTMVDANLPRGVWVDVTVKDKATNKPVHGSIGYFVLPDLPSMSPPFDRPFANTYDDFMPVRSDGTFRFAALPRRTVVAFRAEFEEYPIPKDAGSLVLPGMMPAINYQAFSEICPKANQTSVKVEFFLSKGKIVKGQLVGPDSAPLIAPSHRSSRRLVRRCQSCAANG